MIILSRLFFSTARRTNQEAPPLLSGFWVRRYGRRRGLRNSLRSNIPRPFPSVSSPLRLRRPIKAESGVLPCILTPSPFGHSPYIPLRKHRGRGGLTLLLPLQVFLIPLLVATLLSSPLYFALQNAGEEGDSNPPLIAVRYPAYGARQGGV